VIAGVLKKQMEEAKTVGADQVVATDDDAAIANLPPLDAVADTVGGRTAEKADRQGQAGRSVCFGCRATAERRGSYPSVKVAHVFSKFRQGERCEFMAEAVRDGKLVIPISEELSLSEAVEAQAAAEKGATGKILLIP
jgi:NADPH:quinone reductase-like Zn-dependent oxidoreductase